MTAMLPVFHSARVIPCLMEGPTMPYALSRSLRATAVLMNFWATERTSAGTLTFFSGLVTSTAGSFENVSFGASAVFPTNTTSATIAPANRRTPPTHGSARRQNGTWRVAFEGRGLVVVVLMPSEIVDVQSLRKVCSCWCIRG